ncbi:MAG TPA: DUF6266 family protein [Prolixibacteraceae bacterium]|nr:DUF6266 family protein [Prolixibacteraceae bacterium]
MGTINQGITGGFSGKVGTVIGSNWNGVDIMRGLPSHMTNPRTERQQNQRAKVALIVQFLSPLKALLREGFKKRGQRMSPFNAAMSYNLTHAVTGISPDFEIDYSKVMISQGKLPTALNPEVISPATGQVEFRWEDNSSDFGAMPGDRAVLVVVDPEKGKVVTEMGGNLRSAGSHVVTLPPDFEGAEVQCYIAFQNVSQSFISDSRWAGGMMV